MTSLKVKWHPSQVKFENRFDKYLDPNFFQHRVSLTIFPILSTFKVFLLIVGFDIEFSSLYKDLNLLYCFDNRTELLN